MFVVPRANKYLGGYRAESTAKTNPRGIPYAPFVDKVEDYVASREDVEPTLRSFQEMIAWVLLVYHYLFKPRGQMAAKGESRRLGD